MEFSSHRPVIGPAVVAYKKLLHKLIGGYVEKAIEKRGSSSEITELKNKIEKLENKLLLKGDLAHNPTLEMLKLITQEATKGISSDERPKESTKNANNPYLRGYYEFEEKFRGPRETIIERQKFYLPYIEQAQQAGGEKFLDIGCGRGEMLELLKTEGLPAIGVDLSQKNVDFCKDLNLLASSGNGFKHLESCEDGSLYGICALQVIEHITPDALDQFLFAAKQKLAPGGVLILETINPLSIYALKTFFIDRTHEKPVHPETLRFLLEQTGFSETQLHLLSPVPDEYKLEENGDPNITKLNEFLFGCRDYATISFK